jgi:hypothetical protein
VKTTNGKQIRRRSSASDKTLRRLVKAKDSANRIFEFAESLYWRDETAERMSPADIEQVNQFLQQTENDLKWMKKQFQDLAEIEGGFQSEVTPTGF